MNCFEKHDFCGAGFADAAIINIPQIASINLITNTERPKEFNNRAASEDGGGGASTRAGWPAGSGARRRRDSCVGFEGA
uniref:Uncharacterized protein n=1 Tax=Leersia perrieri TaxID=77586 RepID=A0A0D9WVT7_9ORYZ